MPVGAELICIACMLMHQHALLVEQQGHRLVAGILGIHNVLNHNYAVHCIAVKLFVSGHSAERH
jgi:hypothetical protein